MITLDAPASARIIAPVRAPVWLVEMDFASGIQRFTNFPIPLTIGADVYAGYGNLVDVSILAESESNSAEKVTLGFSVVNQAMLALCLGNIEDYRDKRVRLYFQLLTDRFVPDGAPVLRWAGRMDRVQVPRKRSEPTGGPSSGKIEMLCTRSGMARARSYQGRRLSNTQQQHEYPTDRGLEYLQALIEQPARWLSKKFQEI